MASSVPGPLPLPPFHDPAGAREWSYRPDPAGLLETAGAWRAKHGIRPAAEDRRRLRLLAVDAQKDFCFPEGALYVAGRSGTGALDDIGRLARFILENLGAITEVTCTLDTHFPHQIFFPSFWIGRDGRHLAPHREITAGEIRRGDVRPAPGVAAWASPRGPEWLDAYVEHYAAELERRGKYLLYLWPPHCLLGSEGHALAGAVEEARLFHSYARGARNGIETKGGHVLTENYSALSPEVLAAHDGTRLGERNERLIGDLLAADAVIVAGQAASHCVKSTLEDLLEAIRARDEALARKVYILEDCMSSVAVRDPASPGRFLFDFTDEAGAALARFKAAGMHVVTSAQPLASWPGMGA